MNLWKSAWQDGCDARLAGVSQESNPNRRDPKKAAWLAGWAWADTTDRAKVDSTQASEAKAPIETVTPKSTDAKKSGIK